MHLGGPSVEVELLRVSVKDGLQPPDVSHHCRVTCRLLKVQFVEILPERPVLGLVAPARHSFENSPEPYSVVVEGANFTPADYSI